MSDPDRQDGDLHELRSYGRRKGRKFSARQQVLHDELLPRLAINLNADAPEPLPALFAGQDGGSKGDSGGALQDVWLEIGFGGGEHLLWQAAHHPAIGLIGCEPFIDGVVKVLSGIDDAGLGNIRLYADDARDLLRWLPASTIGRAFILFPDPWPKKRHVKRRLVSAPTLDLLARVMKPGAELRVGTDIGDYARSILLAVTSHEAFDWCAAGPSDWQVRPADWPPTRYEQKARREGRRCSYFRFRRRHSPA